MADDSLVPEIEADWTLFLTCNYACDYCFFTPEQLRSKLVVAASNEAWQQAFDNTGLRWLIHLTGGEPTVLPGFADLCERLTRRHWISLNSNLSHPSIQELARQVDPARVSLVNASFHPAERAARRGDTAFVEHFQLLRERGFRVLCSVVATPDVLAQFDAVRERLAPHGIAPVPKLLRGPWRGQVFPQAYSAPDRERFRAELLRSRTDHAELLAGDMRRLTINPFGDDAYLEQLPDFVGRRCGAGRTFVQIDPQGVVRRCPSEPLGSLLAGTFRPAEADLLCAASYCHYWCLRHADLAEDASAVALRRDLLHGIHAAGQEIEALEARLAAVREQSRGKVQALRRLTA